VHLFDVRIVEENPDFHLGMKEESGVVMAVIADEADEMKPRADSPVSVDQRIKHLKQIRLYFTQKSQALNDKSHSKTNAVDDSNSLTSNVC